MKHSRASLFLMELILVLLFFSIASCVCVRLFAKSGIISAQTKELTHATGMAQNTAEAFYGCDGDMNAIAQLFPGSTFSEDGSMLSISDASQRCTLSLSQTEDNFVWGDIRVYSLEDDSNIIYQLSIKQYLPQGGASHGK